jgi:HemY protein
MKGATIVALALVGSGLLAHLLLADPGYVAVRAGRTLFETTLPVSLLLLVAAYFALRGAIGAAGTRRRLARRQGDRRRRRARQDMQRGLLDLAAGNWKHCEELVTRSVDDADAPVVNYLVAARAADLQDAVSRRDEWLARAQESAPGERAPSLITQAEMQMRRGQHELALATLEQLDASGDINSRGLELMARLYQKLGRGAELQALGPRLLNAKELPEAQVAELLAQAQLDGVRRLGEQRDPRLGETWDALPRAVRRLPQAIVTYARALIASGDHAGAEKLLRDVIDETSDPSAIRLYGDIVLPDPLPPLERAEGWLHARPDDPDLLDCCARLCLRADLIGKAQSYLEASIARRASAENSLLLAEVLEQHAEPERATQVLRDALARSAGRRPAPPRARLRRR